MAKWHAGTSIDIVECPMCHLYMLPRILDTHLATKHFPAPSPKESIPKPTPPKVSIPKLTPPKVYIPKLTPPIVYIPKPTPPKVSIPKPTPPKVSIPKPTPPIVSIPKPTPPIVYIPKPTPEPILSPSPTTQKLHCPFCRKMIDKTNKMIKHLKIHTQITCVLCFSSILMDNFTDHISKCRISHNGTDTCPLCNTFLASKPNKHFKTHITKLKCPFSQCSSFPYKQFHTHMTAHINKLVKEETVLSKNPSNISQTPTSSNSFSPDGIFPFSTDWDDHTDWDEATSTQPLHNNKSDMQSNRTQITHQCPVCNIPDLNEEQFESHLQICLRTQPNPNKCPICVRTESQIITLTRHIHRNHFIKLHTCSGCLNTIPCFTIRSHPVQCLDRGFKPTKQQKVLINSKNITCPICSNQCAKTKLSSHILSHALFKCPVCPWSTDLLNNFTPHVFSCITNSRSSKKSCPVCSNTFSKVRFSEHVLTEHSYLCPICNTAMSKNELTFHGLVCTVIHQQSTVVPNKTNPTPKPNNPNKDKSTPKNPLHNQKKSSILDPNPTLDVSQSLNIPKTPIIPVSKFSCPFCQSEQTDNLQTIRTHLYSCRRLQAIPTLEIIDLPDLVGLKIN